jgi:hypothetical protein
MPQTVNTNMSNNFVSIQNDLEKLVVQGLTEMGLVNADFTGTITFHFREGGLADIDRYEKCLKRFPRSDIRLSKLPK